MAAGTAVGKAGLTLFLYLEVLDAAFSFDGVTGAFAITSDPIVIALGLGLVGSLFVRSITIFLVKQDALDRYVYLEHGAHWAIGVLAVIMLGIDRTAIRGPRPDHRLGGGGVHRGGAQARACYATGATPGPPRRPVKAG